MRHIVLAEVVVLVRRMVSPSGQSETECDDIEVEFTLQHFEDRHRPAGA